MSLSDPVSLLASAHGTLIRALSGHVDRHFQGISQAARLYSKVLSSKQKRHLINLGTVCCYLRRVAAPFVHDFQKGILIAAGVSEVASAMVDSTAEVVEPRAKRTDLTKDFDSPMKDFNATVKMCESITAAKEELVSPPAGGGTECVNIAGCPLLVFTTGYACFCFAGCPKLVFYTGYDRFYSAGGPVCVNIAGCPKLVRTTSYVRVYFAGNPKLVFTTTRSPQTQVHQQ
mmetsp:Transcript_70905/g.219184  ORF Transcript_70905/g.219184 Transcript_70905/m.219184 type:complete len:230 (+) Transcript_70905:92-781(+)